MNRLLAILILAVSALVAGAQTAPADTLDIVKKIQASGTIKVILPDGMAARLANDNRQEAEEKDENGNDSETQVVRNTSRVGYRVQVFDDNNVRTAKHDAENRRRQMESRFPEFRTYMQFNSPYWRVKVGDFRTRSEAEAAMAAIRASFPSIGNQLRIVRDHINAN